MRLLIQALRCHYMMFVLALFAAPLAAQTPDFQQVFEQHGAVILLIDPATGQIVDANPAAAKFYGHGRDALKAMRIQQINTLSDEQVAAERALAEREGRNYFIFRHARADGEIRTVEVYSQPFPFDGHRLLLSVIHDITPGRNLDQGMWHYQQRLEELVALRTAEAESGDHIIIGVLLVSLLGSSGIVLALWRAIRRRRQTEAQLQHFTRDFEAFLDQTTDFVYFKDADSRLRFCSQTLAAITGHRDWRELFGKHDREIFPPDIAKIYEEEEHPVFAEGRQLLDKINPYYDETGQTGYVHTNKWPLFDADGKVVGIFGISRDITERKRTEAELKRYRDHLEELVESRTNELAAAKDAAESANNAKSRFLAAASHDLRQPLSALSLYASLLNHTRSPAEQKVVANIKDCISSLSEMLTDLLDLSKLEAGVVTPDVRDFAIAEILASLASVNRPEADIKGLKLRCIPSRLTVRSDPVLFQRTLGNLIENAIRYTERGGVLVACRRRQGKTWVEVWDTGIGIPADKTTEIFEEFKQLGDGARNSGSGLGLAIVAKTAALLGLEINVRSWLGRGSVFAIELPLGQTLLAMPAPVPSAVEVRLHRIALVDDNLMVRTALTVALQAHGHHVVAAASKATLLAELGTLPPDIVVSDYRLTDGETGFDVIKALQTRFGNELPAILITGDTDPNLLRSMAERGIIVLHKPLDLEILQKCIDDLTCAESASGTSS